MAGLRLIDGPGRPGRKERRCRPCSSRATGARTTVSGTRALYRDPGATRDDLREAVTTLAEAERIARRVLGGVHPLTWAIEGDLRNARAALGARETPPPPGSA